MILWLDLIYTVISLCCINCRIDVARKRADRQLSTEFDTSVMRIEEQWLMCVTLVKEKTLAYFSSHAGSYQ
jgi:hypothetical protein